MGIGGCSIGISSSMLWSLATPLRFTSTMAATAMDSDERMRPTPTLCKYVMPVGMPVIFRRNGTMILSYIGMIMTRKVMGMRGREAGGIWKCLVMLVSMVTPC